MSERWKYQVKTGVFWGLFMIGFSTWYLSGTTPLATQLDDNGYYFRAVGYIVFGILCWATLVGPLKNAEKVNN